MATLLTQEQIRPVVLEGRKLGKTDSQIMAEFIRRGYEIEGVDTKAFTRTVTQPVQRDKTSIRGKLRGRRDDAIQDVAIGIGKGVLSTIKGLGELGTKIGKFALDDLVKAISGEGLDTADIFTEGTEANRKAEEFLEAKTPGEKVGKFAEQVAEFAVPAGKIAKATKALKGVQKIAPRVISSAGVATAQEGEVGLETAIAGGVEAVAPGVGKVISKPIGFITKTIGDISKRLLKGLGANIDAISANPKAIQKSLKELGSADKAQLTNVLEKNSKQIVEGISKVKRDASKAFGEGLEELGTINIPKGNLGKNALSVLDDFGVNVDEIASGNLDDIFINADFGGNKQASKKALNAINLINNQKSLTGKDLRLLMNKLDNIKFRSTGADAVRQDLNSFVDNLTQNVRKTISSETPILKEINTKFSKDIQLAETMEQIFGKQQFKSQKDLLKVSEKLKNALDKSGLGERDIDDFLKKIGITPSEFRAEEAVRTTLTEPLRAEKAGFNIGEFLRQTTAGAVNPERATKIALGLQAISGATEKVVATLQKASPEGRAVIIKALNDIFGG